ncbi:hypothetical protein IM816_05895 [Luteibacter flocculans]|uniref:Uncharacterized protein n=1 Tax=Luteibacter flocculans TaxID=2780091 RepID=A0ABY4T3Z5_9GAMM|nr:hypothetical protein [Luteibacter flocculans]URL59628.1 hypothetical protein IM816_05895 [Luteibacter flocculans]
MESDESNPTEAQQAQCVLGRPDDPDPVKGVKNAWANTREPDSDVGVIPAAQQGCISMLGPFHLLPGTAGQLLAEQVAHALSHWQFRERLSEEGALAVQQKTAAVVCVGAVGAKGIALADEARDLLGRHRTSPGNSSG